MTKLAVFASGGGTNADNIIRFFKDNPAINVEVIICNVPNAGVVQVAKNHGVPCELIDKSALNNPEYMLGILENYKIDRIVLAGFLLLIPKFLIQSFPEKIVNIHPSLLPSYGGKGMYGMKVHQAVCENKEPKTGITIHLVDEIYDNGRVLFQKATPLSSYDSPEEIAHKVHLLEYEFFPQIIEKWCTFSKP